MVNVVRAIAAMASVQAPTRINRTDSEQATIRSALSFRSRDALACVIGNLFPAWEMKSGKASFAIDTGFFDGESGREFHKSLASLSRQSRQSSQTNSQDSIASIDSMDFYFSWKLR